MTLRIDDNNLKKGILPCTVREVLLANAMLAGNLMANFIGWRVVEALGNIMISDGVLHQNPSYHLVRTVYVTSAFLLGFFAALRYEQPFRACFKRMRKNIPIPEDLLQVARRRLLNEPFFAVFLNFAIWIMAAVAFTHAVASSPHTRHLVYGMVIRSIITGLITVTIAFFWVEHIIQRRLAPIFFPKGGQSREKGVLRVSTGVRLAALCLAISIVPLAAIHLTIHGSTQALRAGTLSTGEILEKLSAIVVFETVIFAFLAIWLIILVNINITRPIREMIRVLKAISRGNLEERVRVVSSDEIGFTGDVINEMTEGLKERNLMRERLTLAMQVQRRLLPKTVPALSGLDIAGKSVYCEETGGDYYDFIVSDHSSGKCLSVMVGDVSGHGISSALLMATGRALLRMRGGGGDTLGEMVGRVNRQLVVDMEESGQFMTLFILSITLETRLIRWVRAGHDPAVLYDPKTGAFEELKGSGIALGIQDGARFEENARQGLEPGQVLVIGTDGIWEARNRKGVMFGKNRLYRIIKNHADKTADEILHSSLKAVARFQGSETAEDDITLVVIKAVP
jgi:sigma-B regulation protein RsbU (phosphoserine phosphatase)